MYYLAIIHNYGESRALYSYDTFDAALAAFHTELAYRAEGRTQTVCTILNSEGQVLRNEVYTAPQTEPNEEPQEG